MHPPPLPLYGQLACRPLRRGLCASTAPAAFLLVFVATAVAQPQDSFPCITCGRLPVPVSPSQARSGDFSTLGEPVINPSCDCPFPNNVIPQA